MMQDQEGRRESDERRPGNDESSRNNPINEEEWLIGRRFNVEEVRRVEETSPSDDVAEMHKVMCESDWPDKWSICENVSIHTESENDSTQCQGNECRRTSEMLKAHVQKGQMG